MDFAGSSMFGRRSTRCALRGRDSLVKVLLLPSVFKKPGGGQAWLRTVGMQKVD